jgi:creatinine amidohydrolase/Fe(II)-dependent formamide hydrolase-like protein
VSTYRVMFFKTLPNSYGKMFEVCQRTIDILSASSPDSAVEQAKRRFEQCENIIDWRIHADYFQVDVLSALTPDDFRAAAYRAIVSAIAIPVSASLPTAITRIISDAPASP